MQQPAVPATTTTEAQLTWGKIFDIATDVTRGVSPIETTEAAGKAFSLMATSLLLQAKKVASPLAKQAKDIGDWVKKPVQQQLIDIVDAVIDKGFEIMLWATAGLCAGANPELIKPVAIIAMIRGLATKTARNVYRQFMVQSVEVNLTAPKLERNLVALFVKNPFAEDLVPISPDEIKKSINEDQKVRAEIKRIATHPKFDPKSFIANGKIDPNIRALVSKNIEDRQLTPTKTSVYKTYEQKNQKRAELDAAIRQLALARGITVR